MQHVFVCLSVCLSVLQHPTAACLSFHLSHRTAVQDLQGSLMCNSASNIIQARYLKIATFIICKYLE
jgi:hypothetical protein